ncbi:tetratricopeptide repeat protein [Paracrocinitomix mangrovi]|uniref:tetratricopeptide repeat protein n=1 Tax=Paracrocinitomix mangrovi TaxID=2862509 RepID=UPI001C8D23EF|nr:tetratricopeptide repeat protein [Paracrocinitomix mangrovi]UKN01178.1 tetratricopeptide repeat protein [Paracrocinitomix mangrovi]
MDRFRFYVLLFTFLSTNVFSKSIEEHWAIWKNVNEADTTRLKALKLYTTNKFIYSDPDSAIHYFEEMHDFALSKELKDYQSDALRYIGATYHLRGNYVMSNDYYHQSLAIRKEIKDTNRIASSYNDIAGVYQNQGDDDLALEFYNKSMELFEITGDKSGLSRCFHNIGSVLSDNNEWDTAAYYFNQSLLLDRELGEKIPEAYALINLSKIYLEVGELDSALAFSYQAIAILETRVDKEGLSASYNGLAEIYFKQKKYDDALEFAQKAYQISSEGLSILQTNQSANNLYRIYKKKNDFKSALEMLELQMELTDSIKNEEAKQKTLQQKYEFDYGQKSLADSLKFVEEQRISDFKHEQESKQQKLIIISAIIGLILVILFSFIIYKRLQLTRKQKHIIEDQKVKVEEAHQEIQDSINYAKRIQSAILPPPKMVKQYLEKSFVIYKPKDIVAGDFYWLETKGDNILFAAADCTGHGVPGAMVSVVCNNGLNRSVREHGITDPGKILDKTREIVIQEFEKSEEEVKDGMDIALVSLTLNKKNEIENENDSGDEENTHTHSASHSVLKYAGAHNPLWIIRKGAEEVEEVKADKQPIGKFDNPQSFTTHEITLSSGDTFYIFSDGFADQFGGDKGKKFKAANMKKLLLSMQNESMERQKELIDEAFENWRGNLEQLDDVCVIGVRI